MIWERERYDWASLRAMGSAVTVPKALQRILESTNEAEATSAYWLIDNVVVVQGSLYEAALPAAACLVVALAHCGLPARPKILELLVQIGAGKPDPSEIAAGNHSETDRR